MTTRSELQRRCAEARSAGLLPTTFVCNQSTTALLKALSNVSSRRVVVEGGGVVVRESVPPELLIHTVLANLPLRVLRRVLSLNRSLYLRVEGSPTLWRQLLVQRLTIRHSEAIIRQIPGNGWRRYARIFLPRRFKTNHIYMVNREGKIKKESIDNYPREASEVTCHRISDMAVILCNDGALRVVDKSGTLGPPIAAIPQVHRFTFTHSGKRLHYLDTAGRLYLDDKLVETEERFVDIVSEDTEAMVGDSLVLITTEGLVILTEPDQSYWQRHYTARPILRALYHNHATDEARRVLHLIDVAGVYHLDELVRHMNKVTTISSFSAAMAAPVVKLVGTEGGPIYLLLEDGRVYQRRPSNLVRRQPQPPTIVQYPLIEVYDLAVRSGYLSVVFADGRAGFIFGATRLHTLPLVGVEATTICRPNYTDIYYLGE